MVEPLMSFLLSFIEESSWNMGIILLSVTSHNSQYQRVKDSEFTTFSTES